MFEIDVEKSRSMFEGCRQYLCNVGQGHGVSVAASVPACSGEGK